MRNAEFSPRIGFSYPFTCLKVGANEVHNHNNDGLVKSRNPVEFVIPAKALHRMVYRAKAGIQLFQDVLDPGFRRGDAPRDFLGNHQYWSAIPAKVGNQIFSS